MSIYRHLTHGDNGSCTTCSPGELGDLISVQMTAANVVPDAVLVTKGGTPAGTDRALDCGNACSAKFNANTSVSFTATPPAGKVFVGWGGACLAAGASSVCTVTVSGNLSVQASFSK